MKKLFILLILILSVTAKAQTKLYTPKELKEDADYYFEKLYTIHPDPYFFYPIDEFEKLKDSIYGELNKPLSKIDFILTISQINAFVDSHSTILLSVITTEALAESMIYKVNNAATLLLKEQGIDRNPDLSLKEYTVDAIEEFARRNNMDKNKLLTSIYILPPIKIQDDKLYFEDDSLNNITEINDISVDKVISQTKGCFNRKLEANINSNMMNSIINSILLINFRNVNPPFRIKYAKNAEERLIEGLDLVEWTDRFEKLLEFKELKTPLYAYEVFPENSLAIFHMQSFKDKHKEEFLKQLEEFQHEINEKNINSIFYDLTMNEGGNHYGHEALDIIKHDTIYFNYTEIKRNDLNGMDLKKVNELLSPPNYHNNKVSNNRQLFVLQSKFTASGGDYFCRIVAENKLGILVGEPTGELTKTFSYSREFTMPHTSIPFRIASTFIDYSDYFKSLTTDPDIYWNLKNIREFSEQELLRIINYYKKEKTCTN